MSDACPRCRAPLATDRIGLCPICLLEAPLPPAIVGGTVELGEEIGRGGMGSVHRGRHLRLGIDVAVKLLPESLAAEPSFRTRFAREAQALAALRHPGIVAVHDFGEESGQPYIVMEFVGGGRLSDRLPLPLPQAIDVALQVCDALACAHRAGIVHRDVKPDNLLLDADGRVKVADFGIATIVGDGGTVGGAQTRLTAQGAAIGTPHYIAPEALRGAAPDPRMDLYALGVVLYQMATGALPMGDYAQPPTAIAGVVRRALAPRPEDRYANAEAMRADLLAAQRVSTADDLPPEERSWIRAVALVQSVATSAVVWAFLESVRPKVIDRGDVRPLFGVGEEPIPGGRVISRARFEMWPTLAAIGLLAAGAVAQGALRRHWRREGLDRHRPECPVREARAVLAIGLASMAVYAVRLALEASGLRGLASYSPLVGGPILFAAVYLAWTAALSAARVGRPLSRVPLLWLGFGLAIVPPALELLRWLATWKPA